MVKGSMMAMRNDSRHTGSDIGSLATRQELLTESDKRLSEFAIFVQEVLVSSKQFAIRIAFVVTFVTQFGRFNRRL